MVEQLTERLARLETSIAEQANLDERIAHLEFLALADRGGIDRELAEESGSTERIAARIAERPQHPSVRQLRYPSAEWDDPCPDDCDCSMCRQLPHLN